MSTTLSFSALLYSSPAPRNYCSALHLLDSFIAGCLCPFVQPQPLSKTATSCGKPLFSSVLLFRRKQYSPSHAGPCLRRHSSYRRGASVGDTQPYSRNATAPSHSRVPRERTARALPVPVGCVLARLVSIVRNEYEYVHEATTRRPPVVSHHQGNKHQHQYQH